MDFYNCQYGFFTTYNETWIIRRTETNMFHYSPAIQSNHRSSPEEVSLREAFLFLGSVAGDANESYFRDSSVDKLVRKHADKCLNVSSNLWRRN